MAILARKLLELLQRNKEEKIMKISDYLDASLVTFLNVASREKAIAVLVDLLKARGRIKNARKFYEATLLREKLVSTGIGMGVAIPHAKIDLVDDFFIAIGIQKNSHGLPWQSIDSAPVRLVFLIGGPSHSQPEYLQILSLLTCALKEELLRKKLLLLQSPQAIVDLFSKY